MFIKRKDFEAIKSENAELKEKLHSTDHALKVMTQRHSDRGIQIALLEKKLQKRDPKTGKFIKK